MTDALYAADPKSKHHPHAVEPVEPVAPDPTVGEVS